MNQMSEAAEQGSEAWERWTAMFWTSVAVLLVAWLLGMLTSRTLGGLIHGLPAMAALLVVIRLASGSIEVSIDEGSAAETDHEPAIGRLGP